MERAPARFLALGDSYTIGEGVSPAGRWPVRLAALLRERGFAVEEPTIIARTGWTTDELDAAIDAARPRGAFDVVSLLVGVNDQYRGRKVEEYRPRFQGLLERAVGFARSEPSRVIVLSIPDWGVTPFAEGRDRVRIAREIDDFNQCNRRLARTAGARYVDVTPISRARGAEPDMLAADGLHPAGPMYEAWARLTLAPAERALGG